MPRPISLLPNPNTILEDLLAEIDNRPRPTQKGDKRPLWEVAKGAEARRRNLEARQAVAWMLRPAKRKQPRGAPWRGRMLAVMEPGNWYRAGDVYKMIGIEEGPWRGLMELKAAGLVERVKEKGVTYQGKPLWLWRLTGKGVDERDRIGAAASDSG